LLLPTDEVHVWRVQLDPLSLEIQTLLQTLDKDELERAGRYYFERDRQRFIARRSWLRLLLGRYLDREPGELSFVYNSYGKPALAPVPGASTLNFNLSHSAGLALYAFAWEQEMGVDIERVDSDIEYEQIAERFFSAYERAVLRSLPAEEKAGAFFACWTRKEAFIKAHGEGLSLSLDQFDVSLAPGEPARLLARRGEIEIEQWALRDLEPEPGFAAALAVQGHDLKMKCWRAN
jgi:4'-phosphopantetheinyl transferase